MISLKIARKFSEKIKSKLISFDYDELMKPGNMYKQIEDAYGMDGYGLALVRGVPGYEKYRKALLPMITEFLKLPEEELETYELEQSDFHVGLNRKSRKNPNCSESKIKFCANPLFDIQTDKDCGTVSTPNVWPDDKLPEFKPTYKHLGKLMHQTGILLSKKVDEYILSKRPTYKHSISNTLTTSQVVAGRLIKYHSSDSLPDPTSVNWAGWHNDSNILTCLGSPMYLDHEGKEHKSTEQDKTGLYVCTRQGEEVKIKIPDDCMAFQFGLTSQILSGGVILATPHRVVRDMSSIKNSVSRHQFCLFFFGNMNQILLPPEGITKEQVVEGSISPHVPKLKDIWEEGETFNNFLDKFYEKFYNPPLGKRKFVK